MHDLSDVHREFIGLCMAARNNVVDAHVASFQPLSSARSMDRGAIHTWEIGGQQWIFLAICSGHGGSAVTAEHTITRLPKRLKKDIHYFMEHVLNGSGDRETMLSKADVMLHVLRCDARRIDEKLGEAVKKLCPAPESLTDTESEALVDAHRDVIRKAYYGTTLVAAIVNVTNRCIWTLGVGDSTVGVTSTSTSGKREWTRLCERHRLTAPREYFRVVMRHPSDERDELTANDRILGYYSTTRAIGDFAMKLGPSYVDHLFKFLKDTDAEGEPSHPPPPPPPLKTPPYISAKPAAYFLDLAPIWNANPTVVLFSGGVDGVIEHYHATSAQPRQPVDPGQLISNVIGDDTARAEAENALGHPMVARWAEGGNIAVETLLNVVGGADTERIARVVSVADRARGEAPPLKDGASLMLCNLSSVAAT
ncbi:protein serine/threonine phosphatase 2C [Cubamyces lactineus]|nr:protein serine/threonine phosphatase 2C [Cubamyces lactineus]